MTRRSPNRRTYKGARLYGVAGASTGTASGGSGDGPPDDGLGKRGLDNDGGTPSKKLRADVPENIQKLLEEMERGEEHQTRLAAAQVRALLQFMAQGAVNSAIASAVQVMNAVHELQNLQYGEHPELIHAFFPIGLDLNDDTDGEE